MGSHKIRVWWNEGGDSTKPYMGDVVAGNGRIVKRTDNYAHESGAAKAALAMAEELIEQKNLAAS